MSEGSYEAGGWDTPPDSDRSGGENDIEIQIQNCYYEAEGMFETNPTEALEKLENAVLLESEMEEKEFTFKALTLIVKICAELG